MITLAQLEYIVAVDTYRHFATAAKNCFITQPNLSMQIKKLEEHLGVVIFDRTQHPVAPTDLGVAIILQARVVLQQADQIKTTISEYKGEVSGELRIGIIPTLSPSLLPIFIGAFSEKYPQVKVIIEEHYTTTLESLLKKSLIDVAIVVTPLKDPALKEIPLFYEEMMIYSHPKHRLSKVPSVEIKDIASPGLWLLSDGHCFRHQIINLCKSRLTYNEDLPFVFDGGSLDTVMRIIDRDGGFTLIPELTGRDISSDRVGRLRCFDDGKPIREVSLVYANHFAKSNLVKSLVEEIKGSLPPEMLDKSRGYVVDWR